MAAFTIVLAAIVFFAGLPPMRKWAVPAVPPAVPAALAALAFLP